MNAREYSDWIDSLYSQSRALITREQELFSIAGQELAARYSVEHAKNPNNDECVDGLPRQNYSPKQLLITRICFAKDDAVNQDGSIESWSLSISPTHKKHERVYSARMVILAIVLAADPDANEYITPEICELAELQYEMSEQEILGRLCVSWYWNENNLHLCPGINRHNCPTPEALRVLESALKLVCEGVPRNIASESALSSVLTTDVPDADFRPIGDFPPEMHSRIRQAALPKRKNKKVRKQNPTGQQVEYSYSDAEKWWPTDLKNDGSAPR